MIRRRLLTDADELQIGNTLSEVYEAWTCGSATPKTELNSQGNLIVDAINDIFGSSGIFDLRQNDFINPLAQLVAVGKGIMDATMRNLLISIGLAAGGGFANAMRWATLAGLGQIGQQFFSTFTTAGIIMGFVLYYILPFMPFIYFFFAVGSWVKAIFEAMVGVPLWALAHLKIQGEGLPTQSALTGYLLILEIFLRPILTIFGLLASIIIMSALVRGLNSIFGLVTSNVTGFDCNPCTLGTPGSLEGTINRDPYDRFFFTIIYTIVVYLTATSCFKLIDQIPSGVMRWMGSSAQAFEDGVGDPVQSLAKYTSMITQQVSAQVVPALDNAGGLVGSTAGNLTNALMAKNSPGRTTTNTMVPKTNSALPKK